MSDSFRVLLVTGSTFEPLTRAEVKTWLKIDEEEIVDDPLVDSLISMARRRYEDITKRVPIRQTFDQYEESLPSDAEPIRLQRYPLVSVTSLKGFSDTDLTDTGGTAMSSSQFYVDVASEPGRVVPFASYSYPASTRVVNGGIVRFVAGYSTSTTGVPDHVKLRLKEMIAAAYEHRGDEAGQMEAAMEAVLCGDELLLPEWG